MKKLAFFESVRKDGIFGASINQYQVDGITAILDEAESRSIPLRQLAYILATAYHETAHTMRPVRETMASTDEKAIIILENAWKAKRLPWVKTAYWRKDAEGKSWLGRGLVQLTHKANYQKMSEIIGVDLVASPDLAMNMQISVKILFEGMVRGSFTDKKLSDYIDGAKVDYIGARRIINGTDKADLIQGYAIKFEWALKAGEYGSAPVALPPPVAPPVSIPPVVTQSETPKPNALSLIIAILAKIFGGQK